MGHELRELLDCARSSAVIESPYLIPSRAFRRGLGGALARGVARPHPDQWLSTTDNLLPQAGYVGHKKDPRAPRGRALGVQGPACLHAKAAVIDGETVIVGSYNLDPRSEVLNTELALVSRDRTLAAVMRRSWTAT